jgi:hypothetical protein
MSILNTEIKGLRDGLIHPLKVTFDTNFNSEGATVQFVAYVNGGSEPGTVILNKSQQEYPVDQFGIKGIFQLQTNSIVTFTGNINWPNQIEVVMSPTIIAAK